MDRMDAGAGGEGIDWPALLALEGQATAGPWDVDATGRVYDADGGQLCDTCDDDGEPLGGQTHAESQANAEFVAEVRGAFPALVALVRGLADEVGVAVGDLEEANPGPALNRLIAALATIPAALRAGVGE